MELFYESSWWLLVILCLTLLSKVMNDEIYVYIGRILLGTYAAQIKNVKCIRALKVH